MKNSKKALLLTLCIVALVVSAAFTTLAYLSDKDANVNTFTVGRVGIELDELDVDKDSNPMDNKKYTDENANVTTRDKANEYHLLPGGTYVKDPTVWVDADSEDCWVFVTVDNGISAIEAETAEGGYKSIADQMKFNGWQELKDGENTVKYNNLTVYYYKDIAQKKAKLPVFAEFKIDGGKADNDTLAQYATKTNENAIIKVNAYAIQSAGFESNVLAAWNALAESAASNG